MPGIAGFIARNPHRDSSRQLRQMVDEMVHEPFYTSGLCTELPNGFHAGWVCHRNSYADCQPIWNEDHTICLVFSGEHYADPADYQRLRAAGHEFKENDASSLVHLYEEQGPRFVSQLNGTFSGALLDCRENKVFLFNDRFGLGRMYYHENADGFYFASEAKALLRVLPKLRQMDMRGMGELLICGCTLQGRTIFPGISTLPAGAIWTLSPGREVRMERYFEPATWEAQSRLSAEEYYGMLKESFTRVLPRYFQGKQQVSLSVTGGLDSRMIIANARPGTMPCHTFGGMYRDSEDVNIGRLVAGLCGQTHGVITVDQEFFPKYLELAQRCVYLTDGTMDVTGAIGLYVNRKAREFGEVRMTGNYGSEILREHLAFKAGRLSREVFTDQITPFLDLAAHTFSKGKDECRRLSFIAFKQVPWHHYARFAEEQSQLTIRSPYLDNELVQLAYRAPAGQLVNKELSYRYTTDMQPALAGAPTDRGRLRLPKFIPRKLIEVSMELGPRMEYYFDYGMPHWLAKVDRALSPLRLERHFLGQQKYYHFRTWYRHAMAGQIKEILLDPRTLNRSYLDRRQIQRIVDSHTAGTGNYTSLIHKLMTCEFIHRQLLEVT